MDPKIQFAVPTGNFGDVLAGYYAKHLGLPMEPLIVATNANDILARFWKTGRYEKADSSRVDAESSAQTDAVVGSSDGKQATGGVAETLSPAMDILVSSNFERLLFYLALEGCTAGAVAADGEADGGQHAKVRMASACVKEWMDKLKSEGRVVVPKLAVAAARRDMIADRASDEQVSLLVLTARATADLDSPRRLRRLSRSTSISRESLARTLPTHIPPSDSASPTVSPRPSQFSRDLLSPCSLS